MLAVPKVISMHSPRNSLFAYYSRATVVIIIFNHQFLILKFQPRKLLYLLPPLCSYISLILVQRSLVP